MGRVPDGLAAAARRGYRFLGEMAGPRWEIYGDWYEDQSQLETEVYYLLL
jgi:hypothetical protein